MKKHYLVILISSIVLIVNNLPLIWGLTNPKEELVFLGRHDINSQDLYTYVSFIEQAKDGRWLFENLYMSENQKPRLFRPSYVIIGKAAWLFDTSSIWAYHLARLALSITFFFVLWRFLALFFPASPAGGQKPHERIMAYTLTLTSSGIGFAISRWVGSSTDLWIPEAITFLALAEAPHFILSQILMIGGFLFYLKGLKENSIKQYIFASVSFLLLSFEHPFNLGVVVAVILATSGWLFVEKRYKIIYLLKPLLIIIPAILAGLGYQIFEIYQNHVLASWASQNKLVSPDPLNYLAGYGFLVILAAAGAEKFLHEKSNQQILILSWIFSASLLLYSPIFFQRRFSEGLHIPIAILATFGAFILLSTLSKFLVPAYQKLFRKAFIISILLILAFSSFAIILKDVMLINGDSQSYYYYHLLTGEIKAFTYLKQNTNKNDVIIANWFYGNLIPGIIGRKVYVGHKVQTPFFDQKIDTENEFFLNTNSTQAYQFLKDNHITYIFLGKNDTILSYGFKPEEKPYLTKVYDQNDVLIYRVK